MTITVTNVEEAGEVTLSSTQPQVGTALTATLADPDVVSGSPAWRWTIASSATGTFNNVSNEGTSASYTPVAGDVGKYLKVRFLQRRRRLRQERGIFAHQPGEGEAGEQRRSVFPGHRERRP